MALKNLETARKNKAATHEREAQIQCAEKEAQANPTIHKHPTTWLGSIRSTARKSSLTNGSPRLSSSAFKLGNRGVIVPLLIVKDTEVIVGKKISPLDTDGFSVCLHRIFNPIRVFQNFPVNSFKNVTAV